MDRRNAGFTILELVVTMILLGAVIVTLMPLLGAVAGQRRAAEQRQLATEETANLLERVSAWPYEAISPESTAALHLSESSQRLLRNPTLKIAVVAVDGQPAAKRITVELGWKDRHGRAAAPARLTSWVYRQRGNNP